ncbi:carboxypeptidase regulatory-like domain-containing protein [Silvibacterium dinghuense]|uniref:Carboxypeptidase regulatory-like domain-containing protein n=1 Tax=Silvibacterium dinghuense TaxID=1560006 RepID=A0A4Q1SLV8_9BACT|nr:carboxypeptidase regulatory-like domain-containing protein [Silvibacterium dinghuense]
MNGFSQVSTASLNGVVKDPQGAAIPNAAVKLRNLDTNVERTTTTNSDGVYAIVSILPGHYTLEATANGFGTQQIPSFTLVVDQIATYDFSLAIGVQNTVVTVQGAAARLDVTSSNLGTVMETKQVNDLPLNGRNFTQLLQLTPGVVPINVSQSSGGGFAGPATAEGSSFTFPAINGQTNRSNFYYTDGLDNYGSLLSTYAVPPIIDAIQEFKIVSHTDDASSGSVLGGVVNVVTKSGTNALHGTMWEYIRNNAFDAQEYFSEVPAFRQNQFGVSAGGPVIFPRLYNGKNKTFFFGAYQGFRYTRQNDSLLKVPTAAELAGDESDWPTQIYNPFSTTLSTDAAGNPVYTRQPFTNNQIPSSLISPQMVAFAQFVFPAAGAEIGSTGDNAIDPTPIVQSQNEWTARVDQTIGEKSSAWFRYSAINSTLTQSGGVPDLANTTTEPGRNWGGSFVHTFNPSLIVQVDAAHTLVQHNGQTRWTKSITSVFGDVGFSTDFAGSFNADNDGNLLPDPGISGFADGGESIQNQPKVTDSTQVDGTVTKIIGDHELHIGGGYTSNSFASPIGYANLGFAAQQTGNPQNSAEPGDSIASFILNVPNSANRRNVNETTRPGGVMSAYIQDTWKALPKLTLNFGLRYDITFIPPYGKESTVGQNGGIETGDMDLDNGTYILQKVPPACSVRGHAPCIPGDGTLPEHVVVDPRGKIAHNDYDNFGPRLGFAYRYDEKTAIRGGFGIVYDNWAAVSQMAQNIEGSWPDVGQLINNSLNIPSTTAVTPNATAQNPFAGSTAGLFPAATPFQQVQWFYDPHIKNAYSEQWTLGVERQVSSSTTVGLNYVGSVGRRNDVGGYYNTALKPGPADPQSQALFPYIAPTYYDRSIGSSSYHAAQFMLNRRLNNGFSYQVAYTWSKSMNVGGDGWFGVEGTVPQDPYNPSGYGSYSVSGTDLRNVLSVNTLYEIPVGRGRTFSTGKPFLDYILGNWQLNNIFTARSGQVYTPDTSSDVAHTGNGATYETLDIVGDPNGIKRSPKEWFNTAAYATPPLYTYGTAGRNSLRTQGFWDLDTSVFRKFPIHDDLSFEFRAESFNLANHPVMGTPDANINDSTFGVVSSTASTARELQFAGRIIF